MNRVFVAGSNGQVALALAEEALKREIPLMTAGRPDFDLTNPEQMCKVIAGYAPKAIVNAAAYTAVDAAESNEAEAMAVNCEGAGQLAAIAKDLGVPFIHISTDYVFDGKKVGPYLEDDPTAPTGAYGRSKLAGEGAVLKANPNAIILRTAWVYSPFGKNFVKTMLRLAETRETLEVVADQMGNPTSATDIAAGILDILATIGKTGWQDSYAGIYHMAGTGETTWHGFAETIFEYAEAYGHPRPWVNAIPTVDYPTPAKRPANSRLDCKKLKRVFGIELPDWRISTRDCVKRLLVSRATS